MAKTIRLNISVPTALQDRLKRVKEKVNVSHVCVAALERELERLEAPQSLPPPQLERLVQRLQTNTGRWAERGRQDAQRWAVEVAQRDDLRRVGESTSLRAGASGAQEELPQSFNLTAALEAWVQRDAGVTDEEFRRYADGGRRPPRFPPPVEEALRKARAQMDEGAYRSGWSEAVRAIWRSVRPALQAMP
jgi:hypothetical protein